MNSKIILIALTTLFCHGVVYCSPLNGTIEVSDIKAANVRREEIPTTSTTTNASSVTDSTTTPISPPTTSSNSTPTASTTPKTTTSKVTENPTNATTPMTPASTKPMPTTTTSTTIKPTTLPVSTTTVENHSPKAIPNRQFDGPSFFGGIVLTVGLTAIGFIAFKFYKSGKSEENYGRL